MEKCDLSVKGLRKLRYKAGPFFKECHMPSQRDEDIFRMYFTHANYPHHCNRTRQLYHKLSCKGSYKKPFRYIFSSCRGKSNFDVVLIHDIAYFLQGIPVFDYALDLDIISFSFDKKPLEG